MEYQKKYGLPTAIAMVVGSVIGSGVFFKTESLINVAEGNALTGLAAWGIGGACMLFCLLTFVSVTKYCNGEKSMVDISENLVGKTYSYYIGWFMATVYYPAVVGVLSWLTAHYSLLFLGVDAVGDGLCMLLASVCIVAFFMQNALFPRFFGKLQIATTFLKLIPLFLMIIFGMMRGIDSKILSENMLSSTDIQKRTLFPAISSVLFAYEGWIATLSLGNDLKNREKNLPLALMLGGITVTVVYILYYCGVMGSLPADVFLNYGQNGIKIAFETVFGKYASRLLILFVAISCMGALSAMTFSSGKAIHTLSKRQANSFFKIFSDETSSFMAGLTLSVLWLFIFFGTALSDEPLFGNFGFDISEVPVITVYLMYIPIFVMFLKKYRNCLSKTIKVNVIFGIISCVFIAVSAFYAHSKDLLDYMMMWSGIMLAGEIVRKK